MKKTINTIIIVAIVVLSVIMLVLIAIVLFPEIVETETVINTAETIVEAELEDKELTQIVTKEKESFNQQFEKYKSDSQTPGNVRALLSVVISNNATNNEGQKTVYISTKGAIGKEKIEISNKTKEASKLSELRSSIDSNKKYEVDLIYSNIGIVEHIKITEKK